MRMKLLSRLNPVISLHNYCFRSYIPDPFPAARYGALFAPRHVRPPRDFLMARECSNLPPSLDNRPIINSYSRGWKHLSKDTPRILSFSDASLDAISGRKRCLVATRVLASSMVLDFYLPAGELVADLQIDPILSRNTRLIFNYRKKGR